MGPALPEGRALTWPYRVTKVSVSIVSSRSSNTTLSSRSSCSLGWNTGSASRLVRRRGYEIVEAFQTVENPICSTRCFMAPMGRAGQRRSGPSCFAVARQGRRGGPSRTAGPSGRAALGRRGGCTVAAPQGDRRPCSENAQSGCQGLAQGDQAPGARPLCAWGCSRPRAIVHGCPWLGPQGLGGSFPREGICRASHLAHEGLCLPDPLARSGRHQG